MVSVLEAALAWHDAGCCVRPITLDGEKKPVGRWKLHQSERPTREQLIREFSGGHPGLGLICGAVSGGLELSELEGRAVENAAKRLVPALEAAGLGELWQRLTKAGYAESSPSGGLHLLYRIVDNAVPSNTKIAERPANEDELTDDERRRLADKPHLVFKRGLAETRGEGGFVVVAPSHGPVHPTGMPWTLIGGSVPGVVATITWQERQAFHDVVKAALDEMPEEPQRDPGKRGTARYRGSAGGDGLPPGADWARKTPWRELLEPYGHVWVYREGNQDFWRRSGKDVGVSFRTGGDHDGLYCWSTSTDFPAGEHITKFRAYALLEHDGDDSAAARALAAQGFGTQNRAPDWWQNMGERSLAAQTAVAQQGTVADDGGEGGTEGGVAPAGVDPDRFFSKTGGLLAITLARTVEAAGPLTRDRTGELYRYDDGVWSPDGERAIRERVVRLLGERYRMSHAANIVDIFRNRPPRFDALGEDTTYLNLPGGLLDWRSETWHSHTPAVPSTIRIPVDWDPDATCPAIETWIGQVFPADAREFVEEVIGYCLLNENPLHKAILLFGRGRNGKGTFLRLLRALLGGRNVSAVTPQALDENKFRAAELHGKLANLVGDVDPRIFKATETFKQITGGDAVAAERKYGHPFTFTCRALMVAAFNALPRSADTSEGFFSRWIVVPFTGYFPAGVADPSLNDKLCDAAELRGLLVLAVRGLRRLMARGCFQPPASVETETTSFRRVADPVRSFLDEYVPTLAIPLVARTAVYAAYQTWSANNGHHCMAAAAFYERMEAAGTDHATHVIHARKLHGVREFVFTPRSPDDGRGQRGQVGAGSLSPTPAYGGKDGEAAPSAPTSAPQTWQTWQMPAAPGTSG